MKKLNWTDENWATAIKIAAVMVAMPRWIGALLQADGVPMMLTADTAPWWGLFSAFASAGMALVEGFAFWYTLRAWRKSGGFWLGTLIVLSMAAFAVVLTPYIMANVNGMTLNAILDGNWLVAWAGSVSLSTILIVASVGYAQPKAPQTKTNESSENKSSSAPVVSVSVQDTPQSQQNASRSVSVVENVLQVTNQDSCVSSNGFVCDDLRPITDRFVRTVWIAKQANAPFEDVQTDAKACLNGQTDAFREWFEHGKQSIAVFANVVGIAKDDDTVKKFGAACRGIGVVGNEINRDR